MLWLLMGLSVLVRVYPLLAPKSFWGDEIFSIQLAQMPLWPNIQASVQDVHPPLYYLILSGFHSLLGAHAWVYRLPSVLAGLATVWALYRLGQKLLPEKAAFVAALLAAVSPYWLEASHEIRSYGLLGLCTTAGTLCLLNYLDTRRKAWSSGFLFCAALAVYIEHYAWLWMAAMFVFLWWNDRAFLKKQVVLLVLAAPVLAILVYQALLKESVFAGYRFEEYRDALRLAKKFFGLIWHLSLGYTFSMVSAEKLRLLAKQSPLFWLHVGTTAACLLLVLRSFWVARKNNSRLFQLSLLGFWAPFLLLFIFYPIRLEARYLTFAAPFYFLLLAQALSALRPVVLGGIAFAALLALNAHGTWHALSLKTDPIHKEDYIWITEHLSREAKEDDVILFHRWAVDFYSRELKKPVAGHHFESYDTWQPDASRSGRVFYMYYRNMHEEVTERIYADVRRDMLKKGYVPEGAPLTAGADDGLLFVYTFRSAS